ncbi:N-acetylmuramoyl-L-alanine amidase [Spartinivicinus poritis]|uniref:N-acetylmuramoyl-L-alanine amidase n=1 Tax=Spartinivicinus poritis TaxID=2994640 RepID=A0ABT5UFE9_9GAMM|nr:N-acetylmuramoyl-L-alanine amidase [Spartinivicinus sp. A2-2]MDE1463814.1 N-acetylmuramoyl-L-alanine amidase [Spartinivicinus sp. A2-2]
MNITKLIVHCSDTPDSRDVSAADIHRWHLEQGWSGIGYHKIIKRDGTIENGRPEYWYGAHVKDHNLDSLGICLIGRKHYTNQQMQTLYDQLKLWLKKYPKAKIYGHRDLDNNKSCPNFNVQQWWDITFSNGL